MGVKISGSLTANFSTLLHHESGAQVKTTAPRDNGGDGSMFSPTDLLVASYGACAATTMALIAYKENIELNQVSWDLEKNMVSDPLRRVGSITGKFVLDLGGDETQFRKIAAIAKTCPVAISLAPQVKIRVEVVKP